jgi:hypothetical protein
VWGNQEFREKGLMSSSAGEQKILFVSGATAYLDLEGLVFIAKKLTDRLINQRKEKGNV